MMLSKFENVVCFDIDSLVYTVIYIKLVYCDDLLLHLHSHTYAKYQKYSVCNWNELRTEITSLYCLFHCDSPLNVKTINGKEVKILEIICSVFGFWLYIVKKSMVSHINILVNLIHWDTLQKRIKTNFIIVQFLTFNLNASCKELKINAWICTSISKFNLYENYVAENYKTLILIVSSLCVKY